MSEMLSNYGEEPSYEFTGSVPQMDPKDYFSLIPIPEGAEPILDEETGMCIGYDDKHGKIYDYQGNLAQKYIYDPSLEEPWFSPEDLIGLGIFGLVKKSPSLIIKASKTALKEIKSTKSYKILRRGEGFKIAKGTALASAVFVLKSKFKMGLSPSSLKFEAAALAHMHEQIRFVPTIILEHAIRYGERLPDPGNELNGIYKMYDMFLKVNGKKYVLEVLVHEKTWTVKHFNYISASKFPDQLATRGLRYSREFPKDLYLKKPADHIKSLEKTDQRMKNMYYSKNKISKRNDVIDDVTHHYDGQTHYPGRSGTGKMSSESGNKKVLGKARGRKK